MSIISSGGYYTTYTGAEVDSAVGIALALTDIISNSGYATSGAVLALVSGAGYTTSGAVTAMISSAGGSVDTATVRAIANQQISSGGYIVESGVTYNSTIQPLGGISAEESGWSFVVNQPAQVGNLTFSHQIAVNSVGSFTSGGAVAGALIHPVMVSCTQALAIFSLNWEEEFEDAGGWFISGAALSGGCYHYSATYVNDEGGTYPGGGGGGETYYSRTEDVYVYPYAAPNDSNHIESWASCYGTVRYYNSSYDGGEADSSSYTGWFSSSMPDIMRPRWAGDGHNCLGVYSSGGTGLVTSSSVALTFNETGEIPVLYSSGYQTNYPVTVLYDEPVFSLGATYSSQTVMINYDSPGLAPVYGSQTFTQAITGALVTEIPNTNISGADIFNSKYWPQPQTSTWTYTSEGYGFTTLEMTGGGVDLSIYTRGLFTRATDSGLEYALVGRDVTPCVQLRFEGITISPRGYFTVETQYGDIQATAGESLILTASGRAMVGGGASGLAVTDAGVIIGDRVGQRVIGNKVATELVTSVNSTTTNVSIGLLQGGTRYVYTQPLANLDVYYVENSVQESWLEFTLVSGGSVNINDSGFKWFGGRPSAYEGGSSYAIGFMGGMIVAGPLEV